MVCFHKIPFLQPQLDFLDKRYVSMTLKRAALATNSVNKFLWINIVNGVKIQDIMFILWLSFTLNQF